MQTHPLLFVLALACTPTQNTPKPLAPPIATSQAAPPTSAPGSQPVSPTQSETQPTTQVTSAPCQKTLPAGFAALTEKIPGIALQIKYATDDNFTGEVLPGYETADAWLLEKPAEALSRVQESLKEKHLGLVIFDAYRPKRASKAMVEWAKETKQEWVLTQGYVASKSTHNTGTTVDLGLLDLSTQTLLDMGTPFDFFGTESHTKNASGEALSNRLLLQKAMQAQGFAPYAKEWWHFGYPMKGAIALDEVYRCQ